MKRLAVALAVISLAAVSVVATATVPVGAAVPGSTTVFAANAFSYAGGQLFGGTFCVNGANLTSGVQTEEVDGPLTVDSGEATVAFYDDFDISCDTLDPTALATVDFPDGGTVTLMAYWSGDQAVVMLVDPLDCVDSGNGRLTVRNGAEVGGTGAVDIYGTPAGGDDTLLIADIAPGAQGSVDLPAGTYTDVVAVDAGSPILTGIDLATTLAIPADTGIYGYLYGGNDGSPGSFFGPDAALAACAVTTTTVAPTTTAPPAAAAAVQATPAFTG